MIEIIIDFIVASFRMGLLVLGIGFVFFIIFGIISLIVNK